MKSLLKVALILILADQIAQIIYNSGLFYKPINHPLGFKIYSAIWDVFGVIGAEDAEDAEDVILGFTLAFSLIIATCLVWIALRLARRYQKHKTK